jgi:hypothetical protein
MKYGRINGVVQYDVFATAKKHMGDARNFNFRRKDNRLYSHPQRFINQKLNMMLWVRQSDQPTQFRDWQRNK